MAGNTVDANPGKGATPKDRASAIELAELDTAIEKLVTSVVEGNNIARAWSRDRKNFASTNETPPTDRHDDFGPSEQLIIFGGRITTAGVQDYDHEAQDYEIGFQYTDGPLKVSAKVTYDGQRRFKTAEIDYRHSLQGEFLTKDALIERPVNKRIEKLAEIQNDLAGRGVAHVLRSMTS